VIFKLIIVDNREFKGKIAKELFKKGFDITAKQLSVGDYIIGDVCIERKSLSDFYDSIVDKRIFSQLKSLKSNYEKRLIIVEGEFGARNIHPNAIKGLIASIVIDYKVPIIFTKDSSETADFLGIIDKRANKEVLPVMNVKKDKNEKSMAVDLLCNIPGIGIKSADLLLRHFKSLENVFLAKNDELMEIIGKKSANNFKDFIKKGFF